MLIPSTRVIIEGLPREYYRRQKELASSGFNGCVRLVFDDFEGVVFYDHGKPVTALEECGTWMALGEELIPPLENKAAVTGGSMVICELSRDLIDFFAGRKIASTIETETGSLLGVSTLIDNLLRDRSVCIFRARGPSWIGYAFIAAGRVINASFASDSEQFEGDRATGELKQATGKAMAAIYFLEGGAPFMEVTPSVEMPPTQVSEAQPAPPVEVMHPPEPGKAPVAAIIATPAPAETAPPVPEAGLKVVTCQDPALKLKHQSKLAAHETLEDRNVVWVDGTVLYKLGVKDGGLASMVLPGGKPVQVTLLKMDVISDPGKFAVVPRKLRKRLSLVPGAIVTIMPGSALVPVR